MGSQNGNAGGIRRTRQEVAIPTMLGSGKSRKIQGNAPSAEELLRGISRSKNVLVLVLVRRGGGEPAARGVRVAGDVVVAQHGVEPNGAVAGPINGVIVPVPAPHCRHGLWGKFVENFDLHSLHRRQRHNERPPHKNHAPQHHRL